MMLVISILLIPIPEQVSSSNPTTQDVQDLIDSINETLSDINNTLLALITEEDNSTIPALDYVDQILDNAFFATFHYNQTLDLYSPY